MKRKFIALFITLVLTFAFSANCFSLPSPTEKPIKPTTSQTVTVKRLAIRMAIGQRVIRKVLLL